LTHGERSEAARQIACHLDAEAKRRRPKGEWHECRESTVSAEVAAGTV